jgi:hypothetical protein
MNPALTGFGPEPRQNDGNRLGRIRGYPDAPIPARYEYEIDLEANQLGGMLGLAFRFPLRMPVLDINVVTFDVAKLAQS